MSSHRRTVGRMDKRASAYNTQRPAFVARRRVRRPFGRPRSAAVVGVGLRTDVDDAAADAAVAGVWYTRAFLHEFVDPGRARTRPVHGAQVKRWPCGPRQAVVSISAISAFSPAVSRPFPAISRRRPRETPAGHGGFENFPPETGPVRRKRQKNKDTNNPYGRERRRLRRLECVTRRIRRLVLSGVILFVVFTACFQPKVLVCLPRRVRTARARKTILIYYRPTARRAARNTEPRGQQRTKSLTTARANGLRRKIIW